VACRLFDSLNPPEDSKLIAHTNQKKIMTGGLTGRDRQIILDLALKARLMTASQISNHYFNSKPQIANRRLRFLLANGWLEATSVVAPEPPSILRPFYRGEQGIEKPNFSRLSKLLFARARSRLMVRQSIVRVSPKSLLLVLGVKRCCKSPHHQVGHDIGMAEVVLWLKRMSPNDYHNLVGEDTLSSNAFPGFLPDAIVKRGDRIHVVEFGGAYDVSRLRLIDDSCNRMEVSYDLY